jgi:hypothetical protein
VTLILTVTRRCNLRCSYCPTAKDGWPELTPDDAVKAVRLFARDFGGGDIKMFGGEPLLVPDVCRAAMEAARDEPKIRWVYLSTNGLGLNQEWLQYLRTYDKGILTLSMDGAPEDHRRYRRIHSEAGQVPDAYDHIVSLLPGLMRTPRVVVTQTIPPATAGRAAANFSHLLSLGFWRFNLLPGYFIPWKQDQITALRAGFDGIAKVIQKAWANNQRLYLRNLFTYAPTPFFNTGLVVDADRTIHPSNVGLSGQLDGLRGQTQCGTLDHPPMPAQLEERAKAVNGLLESSLPKHVWSSTQAVDAELTRLCQGLYPDYLADRKRRKAS